MIAIAVSVAIAAPVTQTYCLNFGLDFQDGATGSLLAGSTTAARGVMLRFRRGGVDYDYYLNWEAPSPGCKTITLESGQYEVQTLRKASVNGNYLQVGPSPTEGIYYTTLNAQFTPLGGQTTSWTITGSNSVRILAAASWAMHRRSGGVSGETIKFFNQAGCGDTSCEDWPETGIYISPAHADHKFVIAHELGHAIADARAGNEDANSDGASLDGCTQTYEVEGHHYNSKEFVSNAVVEGIADFYAAISFNNDNISTDPCTYQHHSTTSVNWDRDSLEGVGDGDLDDPHIFSCKGSIAQAGVDSRDYLGDYCLSSGQTNNRATEFDFMRALWELKTTDDFTFTEIMDIWDAANPESWDVDGSQPGATNSGSPVYRLQVGAAIVGQATDMANEWQLAMAGHGVNR